MSTTQQTSDRLWDTAETADYLRIPHRTLDQWAYRGLGPRYIKVGRHRRYRVADVEAWLDTQSRGGPDVG